VLEIRGHDFSPCCGTHLKSTGQIGILRILGAEKYKGMTRLSFIAGRRCLRDSRLLRQNGEIVSRALKAPVMETGKAVLALLEKTGLLEEELKLFKDDAALRKARELIRKAGLGETGPDAEGNSAAGAGRLIVECFEDSGMEELLGIGRAAQKLTGAALVLGSAREGRFAAFCSARGVDIRPLIRDTMERHNGRGGGGPSFFQGMFESPEQLKGFLSVLPERYIP
jgi:alanyl-tRNA synthetase